MNKILLILIIISSCSLVYSQRQINEIPMYGGKHNPDVKENISESDSAAKRGWNYYYNGNFDVAIKRFNQAWMFNRKSVDAFWGFGLIMGKRAMQEDPENNLKESIKFLIIADSLSPKNARIMTDLAFSKTLLGYFQKESKIQGYQSKFNDAEAIFQNAAKIDSTYPVLYGNWSVLEYYRGNIKEAIAKLDKAKKLGYQPESGYEEELQLKLQ